MVLSQAAVINAYKLLSVQGHKNLEEFIVHPACLSCCFLFPWASPFVYCQGQGTGLKGPPVWASVPSVISPLKEKTNKIYNMKEWRRSSVKTASCKFKIYFLPDYWSPCKMAL